MNFNDNDALVENLIIGNEKAYMFLLDTYHRRLNAYALTLVNDQAQAQDIVQNVFLRTWKSRKKLKKQFSIQSFLYKSVYNEFINNYQKNKAMMLLQQKYIESLGEVAEESDENILERLITVVNSEIKNLPPKCQRIFILSKKEGLTNIEISEHLNVSIKTVEAQITKAFGILREKLGKKYEVIMFLIFSSESEKLV
ncbi:RNA polymerase sigma-70 factor [Arenibacter sp. F26102]|uniref:RNA polymerase sigma factor n=1 Tax=Arenibacter sp. F26102 TaxID=2926416 RepID=UPI001FF533F7|nr:RNA polymerase sigma-70 factor [Arenibacter sp. F26102]MCK0147663.1 RNA polymerase sigma-70 factor [Arenibacter sp. F26102]